MTGEYSHGHHPSVLRAHATRTAAGSAAYLLPHLRPGQSLLDVGCGPGTITVDLAAAVAPGTVIGIDTASAALTAAAALPGTVRFERGDVQALAYADDTFDVVHAHQVLQHLVDPVGALREMRRVCRPGGLVACRDADYATFSWWPAEPALERWLAMYRHLARHNGAEPDAGRHLTGWFAAAGFTDVQAGASAWSWTSPAERAGWAESWAQRVTDSAFATQCRAAGFADDAELTAIAAGWRRWGAAGTGYFAMLHGHALGRT